MRARFTNCRDLRKCTHLQFLCRNVLGAVIKMGGRGRGKFFTSYTDTEILQAPVRWSANLGGCFFTHCPDVTFSLARYSTTPHRCKLCTHLPYSCTPHRVAQYMLNDVLFNPPRGVHKFPIFVLENGSQSECYTSVKYRLTPPLVQ